MAERLGVSFIRAWFSVQNRNKLRTKCGVIGDLPNPNE